MQVTVCRVTARRLDHHLLSLRIYIYQVEATEVMRAECKRVASATNCPAPADKLTGGSLTIVQLLLYHFDKLAFRHLHPCEHCEGQRINSGVKLLAPELDSLRGA